MHAFRVAIARTHPNLLSSSSPFPASSSSSPSFARKTAFVRFQQAKTESEDQNMDKTQNPTHKTGDVMSHSFGEGYSTRSDEEGFGGIYSGNQSLPQKPAEEQEKVVHENHPEYDKTQGSEVNEKEKGRNQTNVC